MPSSQDGAGTRARLAAADAELVECRDTRCSAFRVLLGSPRVELEPDDGFVADDPGVVPGLDHVRLARADFLLGSVIVGDLHRARLQQTDVVGLAALASHDRLDALRPSPAGLQPHARRIRAAHADHLYRGLVRRPSLVGRAEIAYLHTCHLSLLRLASGTG